MNTLNRWGSLDPYYRRRNQRGDFSRFAHGLHYSVLEVLLADYKAESRILGALKALKGFFFFFKSPNPASGLLPWRGGHLREDVYRVLQTES